jgi:tetratricopeptide (TPR) repeat protein
MYFYHLLTDLHQSFSPDKAEEIVAFIRQELNVDTIYREHDGLTVQMLINDQHEVFYQCLGHELSTDLAADPNSYFYTWQPLLALFNRRSTGLLFTHALQHAGATETAHLLKGIWRLDDPKTAIYHFHQLQHPIRHYFIGRCYAAVGSWHNATRQYRQFLQEVNERWEQHAEAGSNDDGELMNIITAQWQVDLSLGYVYTELGNDEKAVEHFHSAFNFFPADDLYEYSIGRLRSEADLFHTTVRPYLLALERTDNYNGAVELLATALKHFPSDPEYTAIHQRCQSAASGHGFAHQVLAQVLPAAAPDQQPLTLERMVLQKIEKGSLVFNRRLALYTDDNIHGHQYYIADADAFADLLLWNHQALYVVVFPAPGAGLAAVDSLERSIEALAAQFAHPVRGIICLSAPDKEVKEAIGSDTPIEVYTCQLGFRSLG